MGSTKPSTPSNFSDVFFNDTATTEIYTLSLHDALPIYHDAFEVAGVRPIEIQGGFARCDSRDRKSTRLNSSHANISYAVFCLQKSGVAVRQIYVESCERTPAAPRTRRHA